MTPEKIVENHKKYVLQSWSKQGNLNPIPVAKAEGIYFYDFDGNKYTDMSSQLVNLNLGYGNKAIGDAIKEQVDKFCFVGPATKYYLTKLREQIIYEGPDSVAAIVMETITGSNGVIIPPKGYLPGVRKICDEFGILMICDEVMAGWCRTGKMFAFQNFDVVPDIVSFAKGVTCGYVPLGGVAVSQKIADYFDDHLLSCGLTYSGHPLACAAGVACVNYYSEANILDNVNKVGKVLGEILEEMKEKHPCVGDVRYIGLFSAIELVKDKKTKEPLVPYGKDEKGIMGSLVGMLKKKKFMTYSHENMLFVNPPLIITEEQIREEMVKMDEVLTYVDNELI